MKICVYSAILLSLAAFSSVVEEKGLKWKNSEDTVALMKAGEIVWRHNHDKSRDKPYIHPLATLDGEVLTDLRPDDHVWHRGLWFSWKFINGLNYWEEDKQTLLSEGRTEIKQVEVETNADYSAEIDMVLSYHPPQESEILSEKRRLHFGAPRSNGWYVIDWTSTFTATGGDARLGRTPITGQPGGKSWGGYAGLSLRMAKQTLHWPMIDSNGNKGSSINRKRGAVWMGASGSTAEGKEAGVAILDHPSNMRHPSPWYAIPNMPYFSPALLYYEPFTLKQGESFTLKYRIVVHTEQTDKSALDAEWGKFSR